FLKSAALRPSFAADSCARRGRLCVGVASNEKNRRGHQPRGGVLRAPGGSEGHTFCRGQVAECYHQSGGPSVRFATLEPGNCFEYPLLSGRAVSYVGSGQSHLSSAFCAAAPATGKQHE